MARVVQKDCTTIRTPQLLEAHKTWIRESFSYHGRRRNTWRSSVEICCSGTHFCCSKKRRQTLEPSQIFCDSFSLLDLYIRFGCRRRQKKDHLHRSSCLLLVIASQYVWISLHHSLSVPPLCILHLLAWLLFQPVYLQVFLHFCCLSISFIQFQLIFIAASEVVLLRRIVSAQLYCPPQARPGLSENTTGLCCISMVSNGITHCSQFCVVRSLATTRTLFLILIIILRGFRFTHSKQCTNK